MFVLPLLGTLIALLPLAHASPPDPLWIAGISDAADYDDVVGLLTGGDADGPVPLVMVARFPVLIHSCPLVRPFTLAPAAVTSLRLRSPPTV